MNPDRATLNFLNSFPVEVRKRGEMLQKDGGVTQIFGNHLFIQGRVEDESGTHRTSLRLQGNRWFGSCTAEDDTISGSSGLIAGESLTGVAINLWQAAPTIGPAIWRSLFP